MNRIFKFRRGKKIFATTALLLMLLCFHATEFAALNEERL
jgi:hypothetical protein